MTMKEPIAVLGAGTMGRGIAQVCAQSGHPVRLRDVNPTVLQQARGHIQAALDKGVQLAKIPRNIADETLSRIRFETDLAPAAQGAAWVIEAVPEDIELKKRVLKEAEGALDPKSILATNTSSLSIRSIASSLKRPERFIGLHFFNPPHLLKLLEVVHGPETEPGVIEAAVRFATEIGKEPIVVRDSPGFASSRLGLALGLEAMRMLE
jgi:3-hydroxybutyryl-CoA dehydrogenase